MVEGEHEIREQLMRDLDLLDRRLRLIREDEKVQDRLKDILEEEIDLYQFLLGLGEQTAPRSGQRFADKVEKTGWSWKDWVGRIFGKVNDIIGKILKPF